MRRSPGARLVLHVLDLLIAALAIYVAVGWARNTYPHLPEAPFLVCVLAVLAVGEVVGYLGARWRDH